MPITMKQSIQNLENISCEEKCLLVIASNSPLFREDADAFYKAVLTSGSTLGSVKISSSKADRQVRVMINTATGSRHSPGSFSASTGIRFILTSSC